MKYLIIFVLSMAAYADNSLTKAARYVLQKNEGVRHTPYRDSNGHMSIGIGHKIQPGESFGRIDKAEVHRLFAKDIQKHLKRCRRFLRDFDKYPVCVQVHILDGFYRGCLSGSPKTLRLIRNGRWTEASKEYLRNREYKASKKANTGVYKRMDRNAMVFHRYGKKLGGEE